MRADILQWAYELIVERTDALALLMTLETSKPVAVSRAKVTYGANFLRCYAEEAVRTNGGSSINKSGTGRILVT